MSRMSMPYVPYRAAYHIPPTQRMVASVQNKIFISKLSFFN